MLRCRPHGHALFFELVCMYVHYEIRMYVVLLYIVGLISKQVYLVLVGVVAKKKKKKLERERSGEHLEQRIASHRAHHQAVHTTSRRLTENTRQLARIPRGCFYIGIHSVWAGPEAPTRKGAESRGRDSFRVNFQTAPSVRIQPLSGEPFGRARCS